MLPFQGFCFEQSSPYNVKSEPQERMMRAIREHKGKDGLIVAPCGIGKSSVILEAAMEAGTMVLILCYEAQGVHQIVKDLREHTILQPANICMYTGDSRGRPKSKFCYLVSTYGMLAGSDTKRSDQSKSMRKFVKETVWDLVCCDEGHHIGASTYKPMIEGLRAKRKLCFTATPYRSECLAAVEDDDEHIKKAFSWFGEVLVHISWREVDAAGLIAKIGRSRVDVAFTEQFSVAYDMSSGPQKQYLAALNPQKLNALVAVCALHKAFNHGGIVFVTHLVVATVVQRCLTSCLGDGWAVLSGGSAHGEDATHTARENAKIVKRFNDGELRGLVCTNVAAGAMDIPDCSFAVDLDTDGGRANMAQRFGRVARTSRINAVPGESPQSLLERRLEKQKEAWYYDFVTRCAEDDGVAQRRRKFFASEGYTEEIPIPVDELLGRAQSEGVQLPYASLATQMTLLKEVLQYNSLKGVCAEANATVSKAVLEHSKVLQQLADRLSKQGNKDMKSRIRKRMNAVEQLKRNAAAEAKVARRHTINNAPLSKAALAIFRALNLSMDVLDEAGLVDVAFETSDEEGNSDCD
tara:strand:- start:507 stop:2243 length:1737 start_codon:yes stop_codon:yes gene_type:complete